MIPKASCPTCGEPFPTDAPPGICPNCLLSAGFGTVTGDERAEKLRAFEPPRPEELSARFPQLEIIELLGRGGMGAVYKARQTELDRTVALKILPPSIGDEPGFAERFAREAKALAKLNHPGIVTIYDFGRADGLFYFLMEFVDGVNLRQLLQGERIAPREALAIVPQICDALQFAHDHGIVHRDIKPENILMDRRGRVKVADFGIAKLTGADEQLATGADVASSTFTEAGKVIGTPSYMAPEQASNPAEVDHRADIYALGVVFYQMLTGELPGKQVEAPSRKVVIDVRLDEVVMRALEKEPGLRYQQASVLKTQVENIATSGSASPASNEPDPSQQTGRLYDEARSRLAAPVTALMIYGALCLLLLIFAIVISRSSSANFGIRAPLTSPPELPVLWGALGAIVILGARQMTQLRSYRFAITANILAFLPISTLAHLSTSFQTIVYPIFVLGASFAIWSLIVLSKKEVREAFEANRKSTEERGTRVLPETSPRFSRTAIVGACWSVFAFLALILYLVARTEGGPGQTPTRLGFILAFTLVPLGLSAPFGTTILGWIAISQIRLSAGRLHGLGLAVFDALLFPLLALDAVIAMRSGLGFPAAVLLCLSIDAFLIWKIWRVLNPIAPSEKTSTPLMRRFGWLPIAGSIALAALIFAGAFGSVMVRKTSQARVNLERELTEQIGELLARKQLTFSRINFEYSPVLPRALVTFTKLEDRRNPTNGEPQLLAGALHLTFDDPEVCSVSGRGDLADVQHQFATPLGRQVPWPQRVGATEGEQFVSEKQSSLTSPSGGNPTPKTEFVAKLADGSFVELVSLKYGPGSNPRRTQGSTTNLIDFWKPDGTRNEEYGRWSFGPGSLSSTRDSAMEYRGIVARWGGPDTNNVRLMSWQLGENPQDSADGQFTVTPKGESAENWIGLTQGFPRDKETATIRFALASGPYLEGPTTKTNFLWSSTDKTPWGSFSIGKIFDHNGNAAITLTHNLKGCDYRLLTTIDTSPKPKSALGGFIWQLKEGFRRDEQYKKVIGQVVKGGAFNQTFEFPGVPAKEAMAKLPRINFEVRPVQWVEFRNVALNPGEQTRLQIRVNGEAASANQELKNRDAAAGATANTAPKTAKLDDFTPVVEATVNDWDQRIGSDCLVLKTGRVLSIDVEAFHKLNKEGQIAWFDEREVNLVMETANDGQRGIGLRDAIATRVGSEAWDWDGTALGEAVRLNDPGVSFRDRDGFRWHILPHDVPLPITFALRTGSGRVGVLQVVAFTEEPPSVQIRYKLVRDDVNKQARAKFTDPLFGPVTERELVSGESLSNAFLDLDFGGGIERGKGFGPISPREVSKTRGDCRHSQKRTAVECRTEAGRTDKTSG